jgi:hypothetical protein
MGFEAEQLQSQCYAKERWREECLKKCLGKKTVRQRQRGNDAGDGGIAHRGLMYCDTIRIQARQRFGCDV